MTEQTCSLCSEKVMRVPIIEGAHAFCCHGCHAVFNILSSKNALPGYAEHPVFLQALRCGLISNPDLLERIKEKEINDPPEERERLYLEVSDMWCPSCAEIIRLILLNMRGVLHCVVDYTTDLASVEFLPKYVGKEQIIEAIKSFGYHPRPFGSEEKNNVSKDIYVRFIIAAFCSLNIMMFAYPLYATYFSYDGEGYGELFAWLSLVVSLPVVLYSGYPIWKRFTLSLRTGYLGMETLVTIGVASAFALSLYELWIGGTKVYFDSMSVVIVFVLLGKIIESKAKFSAKESLLRLSRSVPRRGRKRALDRSSAFVPMKEIIKGDILIALTGEKIVLDGVVVEGKGACDESLMTGEAIPIVKTPGKDVLGGTIVTQGFLHYRVTCNEEETALQRIIDLVGKDIGMKSTYIRAADTIVRWFVPLVVGIALLVGGISLALESSEIAFLKALSILLISCPCAIGIAAQSAESHLLSRMAALGAIVRNRGCLTHLGRETAFIFDKTGTVTEGRFLVHTGLLELSEEDLSAIHSLVSHSSHPISVALAEATKKYPTRPTEDLIEVVGHGLQGKVNGHLYLIGSEKFLSQNGMSPCKTAAQTGLYTSVYVGKEKDCFAHIQLGDTVRPEIPALIQELSPSRCILLSGDGEEAVAAVARYCGFTKWRAQCTPLEKRAYVEELKEKKEIVAMVGDGVNDAPAITKAHIGISVVSATDISIQVSDILLTTDRLSVLGKIRALAILGKKIVRQNLFWAFIYNIVGIVLAAFGLLTPIFAAAAMSISSITVLLNARRLS